MAKATMRSPKCGHDGIVITDLLNSDLALISDSQAAEIERLQNEADAAVNTMEEWVELAQERKAEIERLRGVLTQIQELALEDCNDPSMAGLSNVYQIEADARAAIESSESSPRSGSNQPAASEGSK